LFYFFSLISTAMKKNISILIFILLGLSACLSDNGKQGKKLEHVNKKSIASTRGGTMDDECLQYVEAYKKWINDYVRAINVYTNDTSKIQSLKEYARLINVGRSLQMPQNCQTERVFQDTILQITNRAKLMIKDRESTTVDQMINF